MILPIVPNTKLILIGAAVVAAVSALGWVYWTGRSHEAAEQHLEAVETKLKNTEIRNDVEDSIRRDGGDAGRGRLLEWATD